MVNVTVDTAGVDVVGSSGAVVTVWVPVVSAAVVATVDGVVTAAVIERDTCSDCVVVV